MPNWCSNTLRIVGKPEQINLLPWVDNDLLFKKIIPPPSNLQSSKIESWNRQHYGTKWDCFVEVVDYNDNFLELQFDSPWTSPFAGLNAIAKQFSNLSFELTSSEPGNDWQEFCLWRNGGLVQKTTATFYQSTPVKCPECGQDYHPNIDLDGHITYSECFECGWCS